MTGACGYTIATGRMYCSMIELQREAERILGRPILTHEFASSDLWGELREATEAQFVEEARATWAAPTSA